MRNQAVQGSKHFAKTLKQCLLIHVIPLACTELNLKNKEMRDLQLSIRKGLFDLVVLLIDTCFQNVIRYFETIYLNLVMYSFSGHQFFFFN